MKKIIISSIACSLVLSYILLPVSVSAKTLRDFENEVATHTAELQEKKDHIAKNEAEVAVITERIYTIQGQITQTQSDIEALESEIEASNKKIKEKGEESKKIIEYYQVSSGESSYLQYIFGATSITDMIYRISVTEQLTEYNDKIMKELRVLIEKNKENQKSLESKKKELNTLQEQLKSEREKINADTQATRDTMPGIEEQIRAAKENVSYLKSLGCGLDEDIESCYYRVRQSSSETSVPSTGLTLRPTLHGIRNGGLGSYYGHLGQDITSPNGKAETIYPIADGVVHLVYQDNCYGDGFCAGVGVCNGNANIVVIEHNINGTHLFTSYVHLSQVYVSTGQRVSAYTPIGKMGNTGCTSGSDAGGTFIHLHLEMSTCFWQRGTCQYWEYQNRIVNPANYVVFPYTWNNR